MSELADSIDQVLDRIAQAAQRAGRSAEDIAIVLATKTRTADEIRAAVEIFSERGVRVGVGENRAQEIAKHVDLEDLGLTRHFIGRLQTNKARDVVRFADLIHSVDRPGLIDALERRADNDGITQRILLQVNTSGEDTKAGFAPDAAVLKDAIDRCRDGGTLTVEGLMTIGSHTGDEDEVRRSLRDLRILREDLADGAVRELSMGMTHDLEQAVEEGATIIRVGSAVFGERDYTK
ncbi:YggS family pyridoxal phosphate-dependent enzyme [Helcobacillus massiliensis]|uniref:YggS family pyridoxal phosphate-dependent enzyme n=1 Tax=Helcobacillus massiliensis TaxID=521392 RepID=UPI0021A3E03A|nr:YggS family pyridoxal phosphate-dependent enzyme [Helcobacillus massiliensis]MCT1557723.1 YggS family pyridoxal phosphate-dependent enzyme [Helcobacillus massiliensis]MCT2035995.1 YggS family pyridoxal phosphate-dependent enzyme [Helcobacillus massiliensis]MCT2331735.1 YggS family pyridoxal phosphate-dependent enzyme [Helcobacillus massiliensis]